MELRAVWEELRGVAILIIHSSGRGFLAGGTPAFVSPELTCGQCRNSQRKFRPQKKVTSFPMFHLPESESRPAGIICPCEESLNG